MKTCNKCKTGYEATTENFPVCKRNKSGLASWCRGCFREYNARHKGEKKIYNAAYRDENGERADAKHREYTATTNGYLRNLYHRMVYRCKLQQGYSNVECGFGSSDELVDYVINVLQVDPRGKHCHRIDNDGNYEIGNIEFLTHDEHVEAHRCLRKQSV